MLWNNWLSYEAKTAQSLSEFKSKKNMKLATSYAFKQMLVQMSFTFGAIQIF